MSAVEEITWDLSHLLDVEEAKPGEGTDEESVTALLDRSEAIADEFAAAYEGKVADLDGPGLK